AQVQGLELYPTQQVQRHAGLGMEGVLNLQASSSDRPGGESSQHIVVGSARFMQQQGFAISEPVDQALENLASQETISVLVGQDKEVVGILVLQDSPRPEAARTLHKLQHLGIHKSLLLTGDNQNAAQQVARSVGISEVHANLLPEEKLNRLDEIRRQGYTVAMVGDGVNDSPSLAAADVGIAMGDTGTDIAADAAGVVLMGDEGLARIPDLIQTSRRTVKTIQDNIFWFGLVINLAAVIAAFIGYLSAIAAAVFHQMSSFLVLMNSLRLLNDWPSLELFHRLHHLLEGQRSKLDEVRRRFLTVQSLSHWLSHHRKKVTEYLLLSVSILYLISGVTLIPPDQSALVARFGKIIDEPPLQPGIHYRLPWPFESVYRVQPQRVNALEIGFRTGREALPTAEPPAYEWNIQHRQGRYVREPDEAQMLTGDEYLLEVNAVVQYSIEDPKLYLFQTTDIEKSLRAVAEGALRKVVAQHRLDQILAIQRGDVEQLTLDQMRADISRLNLGAHVHSVNLQDVHPALEVVGAFREVATAMEEKSRMINEAQAYANERFPLARGESQKRLIAAEAYLLRRTNHAVGEAVRFTAHNEAYRLWPRTTSMRLYLETVDKVLADKTKYILDQSSGRRKIMLFKGSVFPIADLQKSLKQMQSRDREGADNER
ncbi:FtsH protease activity modulator HflK, partial [Acidobacteria bacterium AH-259-O06]|nr:FtsH protease activity modulator HflK [Acidobacteria bacterium AH-259-O06]